MGFVVGVATNNTRDISNLKMSKAGKKFRVRGGSSEEEDDAGGSAPTVISAAAKKKKEKKKAKPTPTIVSFGEEEEADEVISLFFFLVVPSAVLGPATWLGCRSSSLFALRSWSTMLA